MSKDENNNEIKIDEPLHDCTEEDWAMFYPPDYDSNLFMKAAEDSS